MPQATFRINQWEASSTWYRKLLQLLQFSVRWGTWTFDLRWCQEIPQHPAPQAGRLQGSSSLVNTKLRSHPEEISTVFKQLGGERHTHEVGNEPSGHLMAVVILWDCFQGHEDMRWKKEIKVRKDTTARTSKLEVLDRGEEKTEVGKSSPTSWDVENKDK